MYVYKSPAQLMVDNQWIVNYIHYLIILYYINFDDFKNYKLNIEQNTQYHIVSSIYV
jgi:hypothetical protein